MDLQQQQDKINGVWPEFRMQPVEDREASIKAGHMVHKDVEFVELYVQGTQDVRDVEVTDEHRRKYEGHYKAWKGKNDYHGEGTSLKAWPLISPAQLVNLNVLKIYSVEHLAELQDNQINSLGMGARDLVRKAQAFLESSDDKAARIAELEATVGDLKESLDEATKAIAEFNKSKGSKDAKSS